MKLYITKPASIHDQARRKEAAKRRALAWLVQERETSKTFAAFMAVRLRAIEAQNNPRPPEDDDED